MWLKRICVNATIQKLGVSKNFLKEINIFNQQEHIKLIKSDIKDMHN